MPVDVALVTTRIVDRDAQGNFTAATLAALKARNDGRVVLYTFAYARPPVDGVEIKYLGGGNGHNIGANVRAFLRTSRTAKELSAFDRLVLAGPDIGALPAVHLAKRRNPDLRLIWVYHGLTPPGQLTSFKDKFLTRVRRWAYARSMKHSDLVKTDSGHSKDDLAGWGIDPAKVTVIPLGIDLSRFSPGPDDGKVRAATGIGDRFLLLYVGRLASGKRVDNLIRAMAMMKDRPVALVIVGEGPERDRLVALAREQDVESVVKFAGRVGDDELPGYYRACDAWVTASEHEGFCVPVVEAMACGKPAVVPDVTAMPETAGGAGLVYRHGDLDQFVLCIGRLMTDRALYESLAGRAAAEVTRFDIAAVMSRYLELIIKNGDK